MIEDPNNDIFNLNEVKELLHLLEQTDITEFCIEQDGKKLHIKRSSKVSDAHTHAFSSPAVPPVLSASTIAPLGSSQHPHKHALSAEQSTIPDAQMPDEEGHVILAPMVGTFYEAPSPKSPPFVQEGDTIHAGDTVGIIEAMKIMNEIESEVSGRVIRILVQNGQAVEYGQPIMIIETL